MTSDALVDEQRRHVAGKIARHCRRAAGTAGPRGTDRSTAADATDRTAGPPCPTRRGTRPSSPAADRAGTSGAAQRGGPEVVGDLTNAPAQKYGWRQYGREPRNPRPRIPHPLVSRQRCRRDVPLGRADQAAPQSNAAGAEPATSRSAVDHVPLVLSVLSELLTRQSCRVVLASTMEDAIAAARLVRIDCVLTAMALPDGTGEALQRMFHEDPALQRIRFFFMSGGDSAASEVAGNSKRLRLCSRLRLVTETL